MNTNRPHSRPFPSRLMAFFWAAAFLPVTSCTKANHLSIDIPKHHQRTISKIYCAKKDYVYLIFMSFPYKGEQEKKEIDDTISRANIKGDLDVKMPGVKTINIKIKNLWSNGFSKHAIYSNPIKAPLQKGCHQVTVKINEAIPIPSALEIGVYAKASY